MLDKKVTILSIIAIILLIILVILCFGSNYSIFKQGTDLDITSNSTLNAGDNFTVKLTDSNGRPIANKTVCVSLTDENGSVNDLNITTSENGVASFGISANSGNYSTKCVFSGDGKYASSNVVQSIFIENKVVSIDSTSDSQSQTHSLGGTDSSLGSSPYSNGKWRTWINDGWEYMSEEEYAERFPVLYHERTNGYGKYDKF